jgi:hypothetical protein
VKERNPPPKTPITNDGQLFGELQRRAVLYFWEKADPGTGLVNDRANNFGADEYVAASIAATGYGLAALPIGVEHGWLDRHEAAARARVTLRFLLSMPHQHGWMFHFVDKRNGQRYWKSEFSSIDTGLVVAGAIVCGQYFAGDASTIDISELAEALYRRIDWWWMLTNDGTKPDKRVLSHGWRPESGSFSTCLASAHRLIPCRPQLGKRSPVPCKLMTELNPLKGGRFSFIKCHPDSSISEINETNWDLIIGCRRPMR